MREVETEKDRERDTNTDKRLEKKQNQSALVEEY